MAWHRHYRPRRFSDLDQVLARQAFTRVLDRGVVSGAYLFTGPRGTGKTTAARILAATVNCQLNTPGKPPLQEPCGSCQWCRTTFEGTAASVLEIDAASNRGIDDIRQLRERVGLMPSDGAARMVFIIDEVHMLTTEAFNALLKTLEEPPAHVLFCLATTERHKVPATILSRCVEISFQLSSIDEIMGSLSRIIADQKVKIEPEALRLIAEAAAGSFREAVILLEQLHSSKPITDEMVATATGYVSQDTQRQLLSYLIERRTADALAILESGGWGQSSSKVLIGSLIALASQELATALSHDDPLTREWVALIEVLGKNLSRAQDIPAPTLPLLMAIAEWHLQKSPIPNTTQPITARKPEPTLVAGEVVVKTPSKTVPLTATKLSHVPVASQEAVDVPQSQGIEITIDQFRQSWPAVLRLVEKKNKGVKVFLAQAAVQEVDQGKVVIATAFEFHKQRLSEERNKLLIESCISEVFNTGLLLEFVTTLIKPKISNANHNLAPIPGNQDEFVSSVEDALGL